MKLELIGTGSVASKSNSACTLINNRILVDVPNGICKRLHNMDYDTTNIDACLITHFHGDHYFDLPFLLLEETWTKEKRQNAFIVIGGSGIEEKSKILTDMAFPENWDLIKENLRPEFIECYNLSKQVVLKNIEIISVDVEHKDCKPANGYIVIDGQNKIGFTGDTSFCDAVEYIASNCNVLVADMSLEKGNDEHMGIDNIMYLANKYKEITIIATHMRDDIKQIAKKIRCENIIIPDDGYIYEL